MSILALLSVRKSFGSKPLLEDITFNLEPGEKVGLIGSNGSGKTTLLRCIAGLEVPDSGEIIVQKGAVVAYLEQSPAFDSAHSVLDAIFDGAGEVAKRLHDYEAACRALEKTGGLDEGLQKKVADLAHQMDVSGGWEIEARARAVLDRLGIADTEAIVNTLSGGQRKRIALARALILEPDVLILDEPTNHLDADTISWLESYLARYNGALLLVTHDRYFLERVTASMVEIERGVSHRFEGNYSRYLEQKEAREIQRETEAQKRESLIRHELAWLRRGAKARTTKQKARIDRAAALMSEPKYRQEARIELSAASSRLGNQVIDLEGVSKAYGETKLIEDFSYEFTKDSRIGIIGPNGAGKTTLLELIAGRIKPDAGEVNLGQTVVTAYYDQENRALKDDLRLIDYVKEMAENVKTADGSIITASQMLERFLFPPAQQYTLVGSLSGGERRRLYLLRLLMGAPNVLLLDEPTNDFDIDTLIALENYLDAFPGCLIVVSHDRYFLDRTCQHLIRFEGEGRLSIYPGNYSAYLEIKAAEEAEQPATENISKPASPTNRSAAESVKAKPRRLSYNEKRELEQLETRIAESEDRKTGIEAQLAVPSDDFDAVNALYTELQALNEQLETDIERWSELAAIEE